MHLKHFYFVKIYINLRTSLVLSTVYFRNFGLYFWLYFNLIIDLAGDKILPLRYLNTVSQFGHRTNIEQQTVKLLGKGKFSQ